MPEGKYPEGISCLKGYGLCHKSLEPLKPPEKDDNGLTQSIIYLQFEEGFHQVPNDRLTSYIENSADSDKGTKSIRICSTRAK